MDTLLPTTKHRRGRRTARQDRALADPGPALVALDQVAHEPLITGSQPLILDIGFGSAEAVTALAQAQPGIAILAVDMHTPGIGDLLASIQERSLTGIRIVEADVRHVLTMLPEGRLIGVRTFFPDPWPKKRHHRRRLVTTDFADHLAACVAIGGHWHLATDWEEYADAMLAAIEASPHWTGGKVPRPEWRPVTRYERRGQAAGRTPVDLWFERIAA